MVGGQLERVAAGGAKFVDLFGAGGESAVGDVNFLRVQIRDHAAGEVDHLVDAAPDSAGSQDARVAGDAGIGGVDSAGLGAGVPLIDGVVVLHAGIGAAPGGEG